MVSQGVGDQKALAWRNDLIHILCVDDEKHFLSIEKSFLERGGGLSVDVACTVPEALEMMMIKKYDVIISDYRLPGQNGIDLLKHLRSSNNGIPFIMLTGRGEDEVAVTALTEGANFYVEKNSDPRSLFAELINMVRMLVESVRAKSETKATAEIRNRLYAIAANAILIINREGVIVDCNHRTNDVLGYSREEILGKNFSELIVNDELVNGVNIMTALSVNGIVMNHMLRLMRKDNRVIPVAASSAALRDDEVGNLSGAVCVISDLSDHQRLQGLLTSSELRCRELEGVVRELFEDEDPEQKFKNVQKAS